MMSEVQAFQKDGNVLIKRNVSEPMKPIHRSLKPLTVRWTGFQICFLFFLETLHTFLPNATCLYSWVCLRLNQVQGPLYEPGDNCGLLATLPPCLKELALLPFSWETAASQTNRIWIFGCQRLLAMTRSVILPRHLLHNTNHYFHCDVNVTSSKPENILPHCFKQVGKHVWCVP